MPNPIIKRIQNLSISVKLTLVIIGVSLLAIIVGFSILTYINISSLKRDLINQNSLIAKLTVENSEFALVFEDKKAAKENLANLNAIPEIILAEIYDSTGTFFASYKNQPASYAQLKIEKPKSEFRNGQLFIYEPFISKEGTNLGCIYLTVSQAELTENVNNYILWLTIIIIFVLLIIVLLARNFQKIISDPILKLAKTTQKISETHDYSIRIESSSKDEIGILYQGFNKMLEEIVRYESTILEAQNELRESQELFSTFMEMLPAGAYIKNQDSAFSYVNKFLIDKFNANQWVGNTATSGLESGKKILSNLLEKEALNSVQHFEEQISDLKNKIRHFELWKFPIHRKNKPIMIGGIAIDITARKMAEQRVNFYIKELERNNKELEEFNYVASHDLREPLRTITSYCELLSEDIGETLNESVKEDIRFITEATTRMNVLIQDLLQLSRAGRVEFEKLPVDLNEILRNVLQDLELKIKETNSTIIVKDLPIIVGDATQLSRVFQNLLTNAIKFKSDVDPVIEIYSKEFPDYFEITVADNGIGIEEKYHQQIFSAFKRLHSRRQYEGTGIGLAICAKIVERHNGNISIESESGKGCKFKIQLQKK